VEDNRNILAIGSYQIVSYEGVSILSSQLPDRKLEERIGTTCFGRRFRESVETKLAPSSLSKFHEGSFNLSVPLQTISFMWYVLILVFALNVLLEKKSKTERNILRFTILINILIINLRINKYINLHFLQFLVSLESRH